MEPNVSPDEYTRHRWVGLLTHFGIEPEYLTGKHTACPLCAEGKDRFRFADMGGTGNYFCNKCGHGNGWELLKQFRGWDFKTAIAEVKKVREGIKKQVAKPKVSTADRKKRLQNIKSRVRPLMASKPAVEYFKNRGIDEATLRQVDMTQLGAVPNLEYWVNGQVEKRFDSIAGAVCKYGIPITYHITHLSNGDKAQVRSPRKVMPPLTKMTGSSIALYPCESVLGIAEGIETAMSAFQMFDIPTWASLNAGNMAEFVTPAGVKELVVFADNDVSMTGQNAARALQARAKYQGLEVKILTPSTAGEDWNDVLTSEVKGE